MEKQIKYDFSRCNNLSFNRNIGGKIIEGYLKVNGNEVYGTEENAKSEIGNKSENYISTIKIEWEE